MEELLESNESSQNSNKVITIIFNDKIQPIDRYYDDVLDDYLSKNNIGKVIGGGTLQEKTGEITCCDVAVEIYDDKFIKEIINKIIAIFEKIGVPKKSKITIDNSGEEIYFGNMEGIGIYLDGISLDDEVYKNCDCNFVFSEIKKLVGDDSKISRFWEGAEKTAFYFYGKSFIEMRNAIMGFINEYPLCKNAEIKQIA